MGKLIHMLRRKFIKKSLKGITTTSIASMVPLNSLLVSCTGSEKKSEESLSTEPSLVPPNISLAQWSMHRAIQGNELKAIDFARISSQKYGIKAIEYVADFYLKEAKDESFWNLMKQRAEDEDVTSLLIMVDNHGDLGDPDASARQAAVENHYQWVNAAKILGCHSIRVNAFGAEDEETFKQSLADGLGSLCEYAGKENINILIENHGLYSSNASLIVDVIKEVNMPNLGTLPDFGNWCTSIKWGGIKDGGCEVQYDIYQGVSEYLPYTKGGVSAKSYNFNDKGEDTTIDYYKMIKIVKDSGFDGYIGIEFEGDNLSEPEGIRATKALIEKAWQSA